MALKNEALARLQRQLVELGKVPRDRNAPGDEFTKWHRATRVAVERTFGEGSQQAKEFTNLHFYPIITTQATTDSDRQWSYENGLRRAKTLLESFVAEIQEYWPDDPGASISPLVLVPAVSETISPVALLETICLRFHLVARQLASAGGTSGPRLTMKNEYDVQRLLHALLVLHFDDVRCEEWSPSNAGAGSRIDFLLKQQQLLIEVKRTRKGLNRKTVGEQLTIDIQRYSSHPDCKTLVCFVYDPEGYVENPRGLERDLSRTHPAPEVRVIVAPRFA